MEDARRVRVAQAWAGLTDEDFAKQLNVSVRTVGRLRRGETPLDAGRRQRIADVTEVPEWFMEHGFDGATATGEPGLAERVVALEDGLRTLASTVQRLRRPSF